MTRINLVPPQELMDQHLFAEFREIKMVPRSLARSIAARGLEDVLRRIPPAFTLNTGHVSFFYDKGAYLRARFELLREELRRRDIRFSEEATLDPDRTFDLDPRLAQAYEPTPDALALVRSRIAERIAQRPGWYRYYGARGPGAVP
jgi:deoxyribonuclease (pyrimidine dimer)